MEYGERFEIGGYVVNNVPDYAIEAVVDNNEYMVARYVDEELWFYGVYPTNKKADAVAKEVGGIIMKS